MTDEAPKAPFWLETEYAGTKALVHCYGRLTGGAEAILYRNVKALIPGHKRIILDLTNLTHMDSLGLGTLVRLYVSARSAGCTLELINLGKQVRNLLGMTNLLDVFTTIGEHGIKLG